MFGRTRLRVPMGRGELFFFFIKKSIHIYCKRKEKGSSALRSSRPSALHYATQLMLPRHILASLHASVSRTVWLDFTQIIEITSGVSVFHTYRSLNQYKQWGLRLKSLCVHVLPESVSHIIRSETDTEEPPMSAPRF